MDIKNDSPARRPLFVTSVTESLAVSFFTWVVIGAAFFEPLPFAQYYIGMLPPLVSILGSACLLAIPLTALSLMPLALLYATISPELEDRFPLQMGGHGRPRFVGALVYLLIQIAIVAVLSLFSLLES